VWAAATKKSGEHLGPNGHALAPAQRDREPPPIVKVMPVGPARGIEPLPAAVRDGSPARARHSAPAGRSPARGSMDTRRPGRPGDSGHASVGKRWAMVSRAGSPSGSSAISRRRFIEPDLLGHDTAHGSTVPGQLDVLARPWASNSCRKPSMARPASSRRGPPGGGAVSASPSAERGRWPTPAQGALGRARSRRVEGQRACVEGVEQGVEELLVPAARRLPVGPARLVPL